MKRDPERQTRLLQLSFWKQWLPFVLPPVVALTVGGIGWMVLPKPTLPTAIETATDTLAKPAPRPSAPVHASRAAKSDVVQTAGTTFAEQPAHRSQPVAPAHGTLVALGDSVTFGFNLPGSAPGHPSPLAYPYLIANQHGWQAIDLGVPGWESGDLLHALGTARYQQALKQAKLVTIDIGSNDFLHSTYDVLAQQGTAPPPKTNVLQDTAYKTALADFTKNLPAVIQTVRKLTKAPIVLATLYDPFPDGSSLHDVTEQVVAAANSVILETAAENGIPVANVYSAFNHQQAQDVRLNALDIHPTAAGQTAIASVVNQVLNRPLWYQPVIYAIANHNTVIFSQPKPGPFAVSWTKTAKGMLVMASSGDWLQVVSDGGTVGYVRKEDVTLVLRIDNNVSFTDDQARVRQGTVGDNASVRTAPVWLWNGQVYAPVAYVAEEAGALATYDAARHEVDIETPQHSGLIHYGLFNPAPAVQPAQLELHVSLQPQATVQSFATAGITVLIDGEPVRLNVQPMWIGQEVYVPLVPLWTALGGTVTTGTNGLPQLSADGS